MPLLFLEFLGTTELMVIALVALIIFGPRKLPELGRTLGKSLGEFKRASEDFKRTWEREVDLERTIKEARIDNAMLTDTVVPSLSVPSSVEAASNTAAEEPATIPRTTTSPSNIGHDTSMTPAVAPPVAANADAAPVPGRKQDWL